MARFQPARLMATIYVDSPRPVILALAIADLLLGALLLLHIGMATIISRLGDPTVIGEILVFLGVVKLIGLGTCWYLLLSSSIAGSVWLWASLTVTSITNVTSTGGVASFAVLAAMSAWAMVRTVIAVATHTPCWGSAP